LVEFNHPFLIQALKSLLISPYEGEKLVKELISIPSILSHTIF
jgi:hypothetical protein